MQSFSLLNYFSIPPNQHQAPNGNVGIKTMFASTFPRQSTQKQLVFNTNLIKNDGIATHQIHITYDVGTKSPSFVSVL
jgi:hypothetical protein